MALGIDDAMPDRLADFRSQYPFLVACGTSVESIPFERNVLSRVAQGLQTSRDQLGALLQTRYRCLRQIEAGEQATAEGDVSAAMATFESALSDCPESARARQLLEEARAVGREQQRRHERALQLLAIARDGLATGNLGVAQARCNEALELEPRGEPAREISSCSREQRRVAESIQRVLERFEAALGRHAFDEAAVTLDEADTIQSDLPVVAEARHRLAETRAADAAADCCESRPRRNPPVASGIPAWPIRRGGTAPRTVSRSRNRALLVCRRSSSTSARFGRTSRNARQPPCARAREQLARAAAARDRGAMEDALCRAPRSSRVGPDQRSRLRDAR